MKITYHFFKSLVAIAMTLVLAVSCEKEPTIDPPVTNVTLLTDRLSATSATFEVGSQNATQLFYAWVLKGTDIHLDSVKWTSEAVTANEPMTVTISDLDPETEYTAGFYSMNGAGVKGKVKLEYFTTLKDMTPRVVTVEVKEETIRTATIALTAINADSILYAYYPKDARPDSLNMEWRGIGVVDGAAEILIDSLPTNPERTIYTLAAVALNTVDTEIVKGPETTKNFQTPAAIPVAVSNLQAGTFGFSFDVTMADGHSAFAYIIKTKEEYDAIADVKEELKFSWDVYEEGGSYNSGNAPLNPGVDYVIAIATVVVENDPWGGKLVAEVTSEPKTYDVSTELEFGKNPEAAISLEPRKVAATSLKFTAIPVDANLITYTVYAGAVAKSTLGDKAMADYLKENPSVLNEATQGVLISEHPMFGQQKSDSVDIMIGKLEEGTEYVVYAFGVDKDGGMGELITIETTTTVLSYDANINVSIDFVADLKKVTANVTYNSPCTQMVYLRTDKGTMTEEDALVSLYNTLQNGYDITSESALLIDWLSMGTEYDLFVLPLDAESNMGVMQKFEFSTKSPEFNSAATVAPVLKPIVTKKDTADWDVNTIYTSYEVSFDMNLANGAVKYYAGTVTKELPNSGNDVACAMNLLEFSEEFETGAVYKKEMWGTDDYFVFIPVDADGNMGKPFVDRTWADGIEKPGEGEGEGEGGGITPRR